DLGSGSLGARTNSYAYYGSTSPWVGLLATRTDGRGVVSTVSYDDWLRPATNSCSGPSPEHNLTITKSFDARGLQTSLIQKFTNNTTGPSITVTQTFGAYRHMLSQTIYLDASIQNSIQQDWDAAG